MILVVQGEGSCEAVTATEGRSGRTGRPTHRARRAMQVDMDPGVQQSHQSSTSQRLPYGCTARSSPGAPHRRGGLPASEPGLGAGTHDLRPRLGREPTECNPLSHCRDTREYVSRGSRLHAALQRFLSMSSGLVRDAGPRSHSLALPALPAVGGGTCALGRLVSMIHSPPHTGTSAVDTARQRRGR